LINLLPGLTAGIFAGSDGRLPAGKVPTSISTKQAPLFSDFRGRIKGKTFFAEKGKFRLAVARINLSKLE
jgi:hypothetical protein